MTTDCSSDDIQRWTAKRKVVVVIDPLAGKTTSAEVARMVLVIDCCTREILGWELDHTARAETAERALEGP